MKFTEKIKTSSGLIRGYIDETSGVSIFKGIPYGKAPVNELRFKPSIPVDAWEGVRDCTEFGPSPVQEEQKPFMFWTEEFIVGDYGYSEDCLSLNIWTDGEKTEKKPVVVYFHGGRFVSGGSSCEIYDGTSFARNGVVFVSFNHRVGTLAQLSTEEIFEESKQINSGNYNLSDAVLMLNWIKNNIEQFGGDPKRVTLMGQSSGAGEVNALSVCKKAQGLFSKAVSLSYNSYIGTIAESGWMELQDAFRQGNEITEGKNLNELRKLPAMDFLKKPPIDTMRVDNCYLEAQYKELVDRGLNNETDMIIGAVPGDFLICSPFCGKKADTKEEVVDILKGFFNDGYKDAAAYYDIEGTDKDTLTEKINRDYLLATMMIFAGKRNSVGGAKTYVYFYEHVLPGPENGAFGTFHSSELPYFFNYFSDKRKDYYREADYELGKKINGIVSEFAKGTDLRKYGWSPFEDDNFLLISDESIIEKRVDSFVVELYKRALEEL